MALYVTAKPIQRDVISFLFEGTASNIYWQDKFGDKLLCTLVLTNNPSLYDPGKEDRYEEGEVGKTDFLGYYESEPYRIAKNHIVSIGTFENEVVEMPEDCTGLFSNMSLGFGDASSYTHYAKTIRDYTDGHSETDISDTMDQGDTYYKDVNINFSGLDFSQTKNMTSLFENCLGTKSQINATFNHTYQATVYYEHGYINYYYKPKSVRFSGLDSGDTSNVQTIDRMFANINWGLAPFKDTADTSFIVGGTKALDFPNVTSAKNLFAGSTINISDIDFSFAKPVSLYFAFSGYKSFNSTELDISLGKFPAASINMQSMFRNIGVSKLVLGNALNSAIRSTPGEAAVNYMFANDGSVNVGVLKKIVVKTDTDGHEMNPNLNGYKMFINLTGLSNFNTNNNNINFANNIKTTGYFDQAPPDKITSSWLRTARGWGESNIYLKTVDGWKEIEEVYM